MGLFRHLTWVGLRREGGRTARLAFPLIVGQVSHTLMMLADSIMVGDVGVTELAALTFGNAVFSFLYVFGIGLITAISVLTAGAAGREDQEEASVVCRDGFYLSLIAGTLLCVLGMLLVPLLPYFGQPEEVVAMAPPYLILVLVSLIPSLGALGLKNHGDALDRPWPSFWIFFGGVVLNIALNGLFIFTLGMGLTGAGVATLISRVVVLVGMLVWMRHSSTLRGWVPESWRPQWSRPMLRRLLRLGFPASLQILAEWGAFSGVGFLVGQWGEVELAAHQIGLTTSVTFFMLPMGLGMALTMRIGNAIGAGEKHRLPALIVSGWLLTMVSCLVTGVLCLTFRVWIAEQFIEDAGVLAVAVTLVTIVALSQMVDAFQVVSAQILRGFEDVVVPAVNAFIAYWLVALPVGYVLAVTRFPGAIGFWWGLILGLAVAAILHVFRIRRKLRESMAEIA